MLKIEHLKKLNTSKLNLLCVHIYLNVHVDRVPARPENLVLSIPWLCVSCVLFFGLLVCI